MKSCPQCKKQYTDETLNFCLECGNGLTANVYSGQNAPTVLISEPRETARPFAGSPPHSVVTRAQTPKRKSKAWVWVVGILGVIVVLGGIGFIGLLFIVANLPESEQPQQKNIVKPKESPVSEKRNSDKTSSQPVKKDDLSRWEFNDPSIGKSVVNGNELEMNSIDTRHYFMLSTPDKDFRTENATTKVTIRNASNQSTTLGYGLLIHCDESKPGKKDYAFVIDSKNGGYRIAKHKDTQETDLIPWTKSDSINKGSGYNEIEITDSAGSLAFYINGDLITTIKHSDGNDNGIVGLYTGTGSPISFSNLEIRR